MSSDVLHLEVHDAWRHEFWCSKLKLNELGVGFGLVFHFICMYILIDSDLIWKWNNTIVWNSALWNSMITRKKLSPGIIHRSFMWYNFNFASMVLIWSSWQVVMQWCSDLGYSSCVRSVITIAFDSLFSNSHPYFCCQYITFPTEIFYQTKRILH